MTPREIKKAKRRAEIVKRRGRTPIKATHKEYWIEDTRKSQAGVVHKFYRRVIDLINNK